MKGCASGKINNKHPFNHSKISSAADVCDLQSMETFLKLRQPIRREMYVLQQDLDVTQ